ncbi:MAG: hypothetical protein ACRCYS_15835, partial [Beijerinckiaceae bacterium]
RVMPARISAGALMQSQTSTEEATPDSKFPHAEAVSSTLVIRIGIYMFLALIALFGALAIRLGVNIASRSLPILAGPILAAALAARLRKHYAYPAAGLISRSAMLSWLRCTVLTVALFIVICLFMASLPYVPRSAYLFFIWIMMSLIYAWEFSIGTFFPRLSLNDLAMPALRQNSTDDSDNAPMS